VRYGQLDAAAGRLSSNLNASLDRIRRTPNRFPQKDEVVGVPVVLTREAHPFIFDDLELLGMAQFRIAPATRLSPAPPMWEPTAAVSTCDTWLDPNGPNPFHGRADIRLTKIRVWLVGFKTSASLHTVSIEHLGSELFCTPDNALYPQYPTPIILSYTGPTEIIAGRRVEGQWTATGGHGGPYAFATNTSLPAGLSLSPEGVFTGIASISDPGSPYSMTWRDITATDCAGQRSSPTRWTIYIGPASSGWPDAVGSAPGEPPRVYHTGLQVPFVYSCDGLRGPREPGGFHPGRLDVDGTQDGDLGFAANIGLGLGVRDCYAAVGPFADWRLVVDDQNTDASWDQCDTIVIDFHGFHQTFGRTTR
jgi:hypothetical protein